MLSLRRQLLNSLYGKPYFLIIGAQKAGTTALYDYLTLHPQVMSARRKEVHFFDYGHPKGEWWYRKHFPKKLAMLRQERLIKKPVYTGEATPCYMVFPYVAERVSRMLPDVRLIISLRNPVDRAYSQYQMNIAKGTVFVKESGCRQLREPLPFEEAIEREESRVSEALGKLEVNRNDRGQWFQMYSYKTRGLYARQIKEWLQFFPREQLLIIDSARLSNDTATVYAEVLQFLNLSNWAPATFPRSHEGKYKEKMSQEMRAHLIEYFKPHNEELFDLLGTRFDWDK